MIRFFSILTLILALGAICAHAGTPISDATLRGTTTVPSSATVNVGGDRVGKEAVVTFNNYSAVRFKHGSSVSFEDVIVPFSMTGGVNFNSGTSANFSAATLTIGGGSRANFAAGSNTYFAIGSYTYFQGGTLYFQNSAKSYFQSGTIQNFQSGSTLTVADTANVTGLAREPKYALFHIPLGIGGTYENQFYDFELKGTVTNFSEKSGDDLVFFYGSQYGTDGVGHGQVGTHSGVWFTDSKYSTGSGHTNRRWRKQDETESILKQRWSPTSIIGGVIIVVPIDSTINPANANLIWSYQRVSPSAMEDVWVPIMPQWVTTLPNP